MSVYGFEEGLPYCPWCQEYDHAPEDCEEAAGYFESELVEEFAVPMAQSREVKP